VREREAYKGTSVSVDRSQEQIRNLLKRLNVEAFRFTSFPSYALLEKEESSESQGKDS